MKSESPAAVNSDAAPASPRGGQDDPLLDLPFDHYERHALTRAVVDAVRDHTGRRSLKVLDVGGGPASLSRFLPRDLVLAVDIEKTAGEGFMVADGTRLPFLDSSFDVVVCHDTLEHVPAGLRETFLREIVRVASEFVVVTGPFLDARVQAAERIVMQVATDTMGETFATVRYLSEHKAYGLPDLQETVRQISLVGLPSVVIPNGPLGDWLAKMIVKHYALSLEELGIRAYEIDHRSNAAYVPSASPGPTYRHTILVSRQSDEALLQRLTGQLRAPETARPASDDVSVSIRAVNEAVAHYSALLRGELESKGQHIDNIEALVQTLRGEIENLKADSARMRESVSALEAEARDARAAQLQLAAITDTFSYRVVEKVRRGMDRIAPRGTRRRLPLIAAGRAGNLALTQGWSALVRKAPQVWRWGPRLVQAAARPAGRSWDEQYQLWLRVHALTPARLEAIKRKSARLSYRPRVSIIMPVYDTEPSWLRAAIESVRGQLYDNWELCIADDGSTKESTRSVLREYEQDERIKVKYLSANSGISATSNQALAMASGEFIGLLDHDDELKPDALYEVVKLLNQDPDLKFIYSDEDKKDMDGRLVEPFFKPDWSPDLLMSVNYVTHFSVFQREIVNRVGGFRPAYDGSQDYDLVLRVSELTDKLAHIAKPLYTWRKAPGSTSAKADAKQFAVGAAKAALLDALARRGYTGEVLDGLVPARYRVRYDIRGNPRVAIIIPTRERLDMLRRCVESIRRKSSYRNFEIIVVDNNSQEQETLDYLSSFDGRVVRYPHEFNFAKIVNAGARAAEGADALLFLNNDTEVISAGWIEAMLEHAQRPEVAAVGARLLYPDGRIQHEGVIVGIAGGSAGNVDHGGYLGMGDTIRNCSSVTAACMMTRPQAFWDLGGFDESLRVAFNDVDFCLRAREKGYLVVYTPHALLYHYESATRGKLHPMEDEQFFRDRWGNPGEYRDPYYNPNLSLARPFTIDV